MAKKITLACTICNHKNYRVFKTTTLRFTIKKFCKKCNKSILHKEEK